jgi:hypothetical protein
MAIVVDDPPPRAPVEQGMSAFEAGALLALHCGDGDRAKLDALDDGEGLALPLVDRDSVEARALQPLQQVELVEGAGDAATPELRILLEVLGDDLVAHDVRDRDPATRPQHAVDLLDQPLLVGLAHEVQHAVGDDEVHRVARHQGMLPAQAFPLLIEAHEILKALHRMGLQPSLEAREIEIEVLDAPAAELDVGESHALGHTRCGPACEPEHLVVHVDPDHPTVGAHELGGHEADLAPTAAEVEDRLAGPHVAGGVAASVVPLDHLLWDGLEQARVVVDGTAERGLALHGGRAVALGSRPLRVEVAGGRAHRALGDRDSLVHIPNPRARGRRCLRLGGRDGYGRPRRTHASRGREGGHRAEERLVARRRCRACYGLRRPDARWRVEPSRTGLLSSIRRPVERASCSQRTRAGGCRSHRFHLQVIKQVIKEFQR